MLFCLRVPRREWWCPASFILPLTYFKTRRWKNVCYVVYGQIGSISLGCRDVRSIYQMSGRTRGTCNRFNDTDLVPTTDTPYANPLTTISLLLERVRKPPRSRQSSSASSRSLIAIIIRNAVAFSRVTRYWLTERCYSERSFRR